MEADGLRLEDVGNTEQLQEHVRQKFLDFLESFVVNDDEDSRSQYTQGSEQSGPVSLHGSMWNRCIVEHRIIQDGFLKKSTSDEHASHMSSPGCLIHFNFKHNFRACIMSSNKSLQDHLVL